ncbi:MAG: PAS domain-containing protein [Kofleriaceae bacterium]|nr:PAS domain-containing protein [Kofleriaceae bacterium]MBP9171400.1 PAS domain-containing protein [Kofleriaceae bacterium]MBP9860591.1 PAS domain-containing protein [Kofleriaceae bacterium]
MTRPVPSEAAVARAMLAIGGELCREQSEADLCHGFLAAVTELFPGRRLCLRVADPRTREPARIYARGASPRPGLEHEALTVRTSAVDKTGIRPAVAASARLRLTSRWDPPFPHTAVGFAVPIVAAGELYGLLDVCYPLGEALELADEPLIIPLVNQLALALRNLRLSRDAHGLRDFQARLIDHANALIVGFDSTWRITVCNRALLKLSGLRADDVIGRDVRDFIPSSERERVTAVLGAALSGAHFDAIDVTLKSTNRGPVRTVWSVAAIGGPSDRPAPEAVVAVGQDQTRLSELQSQVIRAERLATLGQLAAGVVHELNNPLTSITVYADYLQRRCVQMGGDPGDHEKLVRIGQSAQRIQRFARELVQYAKPVGDEVDVIDLNAVVRQAVAFCDHLFDRHGVALTVALDPELPPLVAVPGQLEQVLINLVTNAAHAVEGRGTGGVWVRTRRLDDGRLAIEVADDGPGVAEADRERIFEPFFTTKVDGKGTGLGLPIAKNIVEQHKGTIAVDRAAEGGARFVVALPIDGA